MAANQQTRRPLVIASIMASMFMVAIEATIVSTAMPQIVGQLGGLQLYSWVFAAFLLTQTATTVVFGKLSDVYGRKPVLLGGIAVFLLGSILCGVAWSMPAMIAFRLIQGIGAGAIQPVALTVVGDLYTAQERGKIQGYLASVWGISAVLGPLAGGLIIRDLSWSWIFWINVPIGILSALGFIAYLHEDVVRERRPIDLPGAALFTVAVAALMVASTAMGTADWAETLAAALVCAVSIALFVFQERRAPEPMVALELWGRRPILAANATTLLSGMALIGLTTFLPMYVQGVLGASPLVAGFALTMMVVGWPLGATLAARGFARFGLRAILILGGALIPAGAIFFVTLGPGSSAVTAGIGSIVMGLGMGLFSTSAIVLIQEIVPWSERGSATASNLFARNLGSTLGATVFGAVLNYGLAHFGRGGVTVTSDELRRLLETQGLTGDAAVRDALHLSLHLTFWAVLGVAIVMLILAFLVPAVSLGRARHVPAE
jgi:EmrB/QacA subfamily drug resistance transporter